MTIVERSPDRVVVEDRRWRAAAVLAVAAGVVSLVVGAANGFVWQTTLGPGLLLGLAWVAGYRVVTTFTRGAPPRVRHETRRIGRRTSREYTAPIADVALVVPPLSRHRVAWLAQVTFADGSALWLSPSPRRRPLVEAVVAEIRAWVGLPPLGDFDAHLQATARAGDRIGATRLAREGEKRSVAAARVKREP